MISKVLEFRQSTLHCLGSCLAKIVGVFYGIQKWTINEKRVGNKTAGVNIRDWGSNPG